MFNIGKINTLKVIKETSSGYYLGNDEDYGEVFLPPAMALEKLQEGQEVDVFIYVDTKDKLIATMSTPLAQAEEYVLLRCIEVQEFGAFFDLGIEKHLLVPANEQKIKVREDEFHLVRVSIEEGTDRVFGTTKFGKYIENMSFDINEGDEVTVVPVNETDLGFRVIINKKYIGLIYSNEVFSKIELDKEITAYVKKIRDDGFVDVALQIQGIKNLDASKKVILNHLFKQNGSTKLNDKSSPEEIKRLLGMSKKTFKSALGMLYKDKMVKLSKDGTELVHKHTHKKKK